MYVLTVAFELGTGGGDAEERMLSAREYLLTLPGIVDVSVLAMGDTQFDLLSTWSSFDEAQTSLSALGVNDELADRVGEVLQEPEAAQSLRLE